MEDRLAAADTSEDKGKDIANGDGAGGDATIKHLKERLADTHDLLAEISLENERYAHPLATTREFKLTDKHFSTTQVSQRDG